MLFDRLNVALLRAYCQFKYVIKNQTNIFGPGGPFGPEPVMMLAPAASNNILDRIWLKLENSKSTSLGEVKTPSFLDSIFFAVPKQRKTIERRLRGRFGDDKWEFGSKMLKRKSDLITCETCGNYREKLRLCVHCFNRVEEESKAIKEAIASQYGLYPIDKPWEIRYKDDPKDQVSDKILVEVDKERPIWFNKSLLQRANEVIPETNVTITDDRSKN